MDLFIQPLPAGYQDLIESLYEYILSNATDKEDLHVQVLKYAIKLLAYNDIVCLTLEDALAIEEELNK